MWSMNEDVASMESDSLVGEIHARLVILETLMEHPLFNRRNIRATLTRARMLTAELRRRQENR